MKKDRMNLIWGIEKIEKELAKTHAPASNIMSVCTEVLKQVNEILHDTDTQEEKTKLYTIVKDVKCLKCGNIGAVQSYGTHNKTKDQIFHTLGFGGTVPHSCLNCGNSGLIGFGGLEGYKKAFVKIDAPVSAQNVEVAP